MYLNQFSLRLTLENRPVIVVPGPCPGVELIAAVMESDQNFAEVQPFSAARPSFSGERYFNFAPAISLPIFTEAEPSWPW